MWLMQKGPGGIRTDTPSAPGSAFSVMKHLHSMPICKSSGIHRHIPCLLWPNVDSSLRELPAALPWVGMGTAICSWLAFTTRWLLLGFQAGEIISRGKGRIHCYICALWSHRTHIQLPASSHLQVQEAKGQPGWLWFCDPPLLNYYITTNVPF